jgi:hypothetical protein
MVGKNQKHRSEKFVLKNRKITLDKLAFLV